MYNANDIEQSSVKRRKLSHGDASAERSDIDSIDSSNDIDEQMVREEAANDTDANTKSDIHADAIKIGKLDVTSTRDPAGKPLSKNQLKKLRKKQEWEAGRDDRKAKRKQKIQEKKARKREYKEQVQEERKSKGLDPLPDKKPQRRPVRLPITFIIDCGFDDKMVDNERVSLGSQLTRSYSDNAKATLQAHLYISSWGGLLKERFDTVLNKHYKNWRGIQFLSEDFAAAAQQADSVMKCGKGGRFTGIFSKYAGSEATTFGDQLISEVPAASSSPQQESEAQSQDQPKAESPTMQHRNRGPSPETINRLQQQSEIIYLTSDSPNTLDELKPYSTYIIGGLVDKNRYKGLCYQTACDRGIKTAKLPIGQFMEMQSRFVLATNHVVEIMIRYLECGDWGTAFMQVIPKRKGGKLKNGGHKDEKVESGSSDEDEDEPEPDKNRLESVEVHAVESDPAPPSTELHPSA